MRVRTHQQRIALHLIVVGVMAMTMVFAAAAPGMAHHCTGGGSVDDDGGDVIAECHGVTPGRPPTSGSHSYLWDLYCSELYPFEDGFRVEFKLEGPMTPEEVELFGFDPTGEYVWYTILCWANGTATDVGAITVEETPPIPPEVLRDRARARINPPPPSPATSPSLDAMTYVQLPTWLWLNEAEWVSITESETQGFTTVVVTATPVEATWTMGDGNEVVCAGPGVAWERGLAEDATDCAYIYRSSTYGEPAGRFSAEVSVLWVFEWWINDRPQGEFGDLALSTGFEVAVAEIQAVESGG